ncbi:protein DpdE [Blastopirellula marina]|uniref:Type III restriction enzyme, res subunit n=1 Tax=Blastopirellula marina DSM 3645 TaxID=314230 RepID=A3ZSC5_9BACT|nr:protein DpdE [Blastopirellula marina]EAQ80585.1 Type III restriction enzyme, res subunit [Blastopirellula marina DSM 3645]
MILSIGQFAITSRNMLGIGTVVDVDIDTVSIQYFDSPAPEAVKIVEVCVDSVRPIQLSNETRVFYRDPTTFRWSVGRVLDFQKDTRKYLVCFPNGHRELLKESTLFTRWAMPIADPIELLAYQLNETPFWHEGRTSFIQNIYSQRRLSLGMPSLLSSSIDLVEHQFSVARKVLCDPFQRYLLADEVGLGKTIETGILIRQYVLDEPTEHKVLLIVPSVLITQWKLELKLRFDLSDQLGESIHVVSRDDIEAILQLGPVAGMVVIDEAHHLAAWAVSLDPSERSRYNTVAAFTADMQKRVLLLSATPVLNNERAFLAMLHLIDPVLYPLDEFTAFKERVENRQKVAEVLLSLQEDESNYFLKQSLESLDAFFIKDRRFSALCQELLALIDEDVEEEHPRRSELIRSLRLHVSEAWRLHRRMIRNRRGTTTQGLIPGRQGCEVCEWQSAQQEKLESLFHEWRIGLAAHVFDNPEFRESGANFAKELMQAVVSNPKSVARLVDFRLRADNDQSDCFPMFSTEPETLIALANHARRCNLADKHRVLLELIQQLETVSRSKMSIVVFANDAETADDIFDFLRVSLPGRIWRHSRENSGWTQALAFSASSVLLCDATAEEGLNLQKRSACIVNFDLPLSPNRIEQRIGRLDRFGTGKAIKCYNLVLASSLIEIQWNHLLDRGLGVFDQSIASLQYLVEDQLARVWDEFIDAGHEAFEEATDRLGGDDGLVKRERRIVLAQDELDSDGFSAKCDLEAFNALAQLDVKASALCEAIDGWMVKRLHFRKSGEKGRHDQVVKYEMCVRDDFKPWKKDRTSLMPYHEWDHFFRKSLDTDVRPREPVISQTHLMTFDRQEAQAREVPLARIGHPFVDAITHQIRLDDRGVCFAMWRYCPELVLDEPATIFFQIYFLIEADEAVFRDLKERWPSASITALRRRADDLFPPIAFRMLLDSDLNRITDTGLLKTLLQPYSSKGPGQPGPQDFNLNFDRWKTVEPYCDSNVWRELCYAAGERAKAGLLEQTKLPQKIKETVSRAQRMFALRRDQFQSRIVRSTREREVLVSEMSFEKAFHEALIRSIESPSIRVDSAGGIFLSNVNPFADERPREDDE